MNNTLRVIAAIALSLVLAACGAVSFPNARLDATDRDVETVSGVLARPDGNGPFPAVVLLHSCGGFTSHVTTDWPNYLSGLGYAVLSVDTFGSRGYQRCPNPYMARPPFVKDAYGALNYLAAQPFIDRNRIAVMGFSLGANHINGGVLSWDVRGADGLDFKGAVGFYGHCSWISLATMKKMPVMQIAAEHDPQHAIGCRALARTNPEIEVHVIPGAYHAFDSVEADGKEGFIGEPMRYSYEAVKRSRELTRAFLAKHLGGRPGS